MEMVGSVGRNAAKRVDLPAMPAAPMVDARMPPVYHATASGRLGDRGSRKSRVEESPHSIGHDAGETPGRSDLSERATERDSQVKGLGPKPGDDEKVV
jgi:hypothetical protein